MALLEGTEVKCPRVPKRTVSQTGFSQVPQLASSLILDLQEAFSMDSRRRRYTRMVGQMDIFGIPGRLRMWNMLVIRHVMGTLGMDFVFGFEASLVSRLREARE